MKTLSKNSILIYPYYMPMKSFPYASFACTPLYPQNALPKFFPNDNEYVSAQVSALFPSLSLTHTLTQR